MEYLIVVVGFAGGWLLFAGPLVQARLELRAVRTEQALGSAKPASRTRPGRAPASP